MSEENGTHEGAVSIKSDDNDKRLEDSHWLVEDTANLSVQDEAWQRRGMNTPNPSGYGKAICLLSNCNQKTVQWHNIISFKKIIQLKSDKRGERVEAERQCRG